jgi:aspartate kinase
MSLIVHKYGGTSMGSTERIRNVARRVAKWQAAGHQMVVVPSAMSGETNRLLALAKELAPATLTEAYNRELDMLAATGEQASSALLAIALQAQGLESVSYAGWQVPIRTNSAYTKARIESIDDARVRADLDAGRVVIVTGFQGLDEQGNITTLGRGGSDTSAVAVAAALSCPCDIYTDVDGVYTTDPRIESRARRLEKISYEEMLEMASLGARVLQTRSVELAMAKRVPLRVLSSFIEPDENGILPAKSGTLICDEEEIVEKRIVSGVTMSRDEARITLLGLSDRVEAPADVFARLAGANVNVDMIVQSQARSEGAVNLTFTTGRRDAARAAELMRAARTELGFEELRVDEDVAKVSVVGVGMRSHAGVAQTMFRALADKGVKFQAISTSEIKISVLIDAAYAELAVRALHAAYGLEQV